MINILKNLHVLSECTLCILYNGIHATVCGYMAAVCLQLLVFGSFYVWFHVIMASVVSANCGCTGMNVRWSLFIYLFPYVLPFGLTLETGCIPNIEWSLPVWNDWSQQDKYNFIINGFWNFKDHHELTCTFYGLPKLFKIALFSTIQTQWF